jgi:hypothetical protein
MRVVEADNQGVAVAFMMVMGKYLFMKFDVVLMYASLLYLIVFIKFLKGLVQYLL